MSKKSKQPLKSLNDLKALFPEESSTVAAQARRLRRELTHAAPVRSAAAPREEPEEPDEDAFAQAMRGVAPLAVDGREVVPGPPPPQAPFQADQEWEKALGRFMAGDLDFDLEFTDEYMSGSVRGLDSKIFQQLKAGKFSREAHVDLHGLNSGQAHEAVMFFLRESYLQGLRCVLVICGRGKNSPGGLSVIKRELQGWLTREPLRRAVLAFCTARAADGGAGAVYVLLRKLKKSTGKVLWEKTANWEEKD